MRSCCTNRHIPFSRGDQKRRRRSSRADRSSMTERSAPQGARVPPHAQTDASSTPVQVSLRQLSLSASTPVLKPKPTSTSSTVAPLLDLLEVGDICSSLCGFLTFGDMKSFSSLNNRLVALSLTRANFFKRVRFLVPTFMDGAQVALFLSQIRPEMIPHIKQLRIELGVRMVKASSNRGRATGGRNRGGDSRSILSFSFPQGCAWQFFPDVEVLDISNSMMEKLTSIHKLTKLKSIDMSGHFAPDLEPLAQATTLKHLYLNNSNVLNANVAHLKNLHLLETLELQNCGFISDISCLAGLVNLRRLVLSGTIAKDFSALSALTKLQYFEHICKPRQSWPTKELPLRAPELEYCDVSGTPVHDVDCLRFSPRLRHLDISWTALTDAPPLSHLKKLKVLIVSAPLPPNLAYYAPLETMRELEKVEFHKIGQASLDPPTVEALFPPRARPLLVFP